MISSFEKLNTGRENKEGTVENIVILRTMAELCKLKVGLKVKYRNSPDDVFIYAVVGHIYRFLRTEQGHKVFEEETKWGKRSWIAEESSVYLWDAIVTGGEKRVKNTEAYLKEHPGFEVQTLTTDEFKEACEKEYSWPRECMSHF